MTSNSASTAAQQTADPEGSANRDYAGTLRKLRGDYKAVWNSLSGSKTDAYLVVSGYTDEDKFHADAEDTVDILRDTVGVKPADVFLEIGCGVGRVGRVLSPFVREWVGCDVSSNMLRLAGRRLLGLSNIRLQEISGYDLQPIPDNSIDVVYTTVVFMHLEEWDRYNYILEAKRVLKPGGKMILELPCLNKICYYVAKCVQDKLPLDETMLLYPLFGSPKGQDPLMGHKWGYFKETLRDLLERAGMQEIQFVTPRYHFPMRDMRVECRK